MTTDHSFTLGEDGSLVIHTTEMGHAGVYELEVANELGVDKCRVSLGVYGSEIELPGDYQMTIPAVPLAKFGPYVAKSHEKNNTGFNNQYRVSVNGYCHMEAENVTLSSPLSVSGVYYQTSFNGGFKQ